MFEMATTRRFGTSTRHVSSVRSSHRANILNCGYAEIGIGYATGGSYRYYWTQDFGTR